MFKIGQWVYFSNIPGTVRIINIWVPWYTPGKALYEVSFKGNFYYAYEWELEK